MQITDAQVQVWGANTPAPFSKDDLLRQMGAAGVHRAIVVPLAWEGDRNDLALEDARLHPERLAVMGRLDLESPAARGALAAFREPGMLGLRIQRAYPGSAGKTGNG